MEDADPEIHGLLQEAQAAQEDVQEFAWQHLQRYRSVALEAARSSLRLPEREARVNEAREQLRQSLKSLLAWAKDSGRMNEGLSP